MFECVHSDLGSQHVLMLSESSSASYLEPQGVYFVELACRAHFRILGVVPVLPPAAEGFPAGRAARYLAPQPTHRTGCCKVARVVELLQAQRQDSGGEVLNRQ